MFRMTDLCFLHRSNLADLVDNIFPNIKMSIYVLHIKIYIILYNIKIKS